LTPTARSLAYCRENFWPVANVEKWIPQARIRKDAFGMFDLIVILPGAILGVQTTSGSNHAARREKIVQNACTGPWMKAGGKIAIWSWSQRGPRKTWTLRAEEVV